jgi:hypothetical protein
MKKKRNKGSSMVEVLAGFSILMILMAGITGIIKVSSNMIMEAKDMMSEQDQFTAEFYKKDYGDLEQDASYDSLEVRLLVVDSQGNQTQDGGSIYLDHAKLRKISSREDDSAYMVYQFEESDTSTE